MGIGEVEHLSAEQFGEALSSVDKVRSPLRRIDSTQVHVVEAMTGHFPDLGRHCP
jgi:hypothetical protein